MNVEDIEKFLNKQTDIQKAYVKINFKKIDTKNGL